MHVMMRHKSARREVEVRARWYNQALLGRLALHQSCCKYTDMISDCWRWQMDLSRRESACDPAGVQYRYSDGAASCHATCVSLWVSCAPRHAVGLGESAAGTATGAKMSVRRVARAHVLHRPDINFATRVNLSFSEKMTELRRREAEGSATDTRCTMRHDIQ